MKGFAVAHSESALRSMVARLASFAPDDANAVLATLDERQRARVATLLNELDHDWSGGSDDLEAPGMDMPVHGLSPWLLERLALPDADVAELPDARAMTAHALAILRQCASELTSAPGSRDAVQMAPRGFWSQLTGSLRKQTVRK